jgi:hypothetical protein
MRDAGARRGRTALRDARHRAKDLANQPGAKRRDDLRNFDNVKTLVFCNGRWCGQSSTTITDLQKIGYPAHKILWYRGDMQDWESLGLATLKPLGK